MTLDLKQCAALFGVVALMTACSAESQRISAAKESVDQQKDDQKKLIDQRTAELKRNVDLNRDKYKQYIAARKQELDTEKKNLDVEAKDADKYSDLAKKNLGVQQDACKKTVDQNARELKAKIDDYATAHK